MFTLDPVDEPMQAKLVVLAGNSFGLVIPLLFAPFLAAVALTGLSAAGHRSDGEGYDETRSGRHQPAAKLAVSLDHHMVSPAGCESASMVDLRDGRPPVLQPGVILGPGH
jgi:hypothetical protein